MIFSTDLKSVLVCALLTSSVDGCWSHGATCFHGLALLTQLFIRGHVGRRRGVSWWIKRGKELNLQCKALNMFLYPPICTQVYACGQMI